MIPDANGLDPAEVQDYAGRLSEVAQVSSVSAVGGSWVNGRLVGPVSAPAGEEGGAAFMTITSTAPLYSEASERQLDDLHAMPVPGRTALLVARPRPIATPLKPSRVACARSRPHRRITFVLLFLLTGRLLLQGRGAERAVVDGHRRRAGLGVPGGSSSGALGRPVTGTLEVDLPVLLFCIAFGLSMDYEVFLISRIREHWLGIGPVGPGANDESVALGRGAHRDG